MWKWVYLICFILLAGNVFSQKGFERNYGNPGCYDEGYGAIPLNGGYLLSTSQGCGGGPANNLHRTIRINQFGDTLYTQLGNSYNGFMKRIGTNDILYLGREQANLLGDTSFVYLTDTAGDLKWSTPLFYGCFTSVYHGIKAKDGGYYITGFSSSTSCSAPEYDAFLTKLDSSGQEIWSRKYDLGADDQLYDLQQLDNRELILAGWTNSVGQGQGDAWLLKTNEVGDTIWSKTYGNATNERCYGLAVSEDGYLLQLAADSSSTIAVDSNGVQLWRVNAEPACGGAYHKVLFTKDFRSVSLSYQNVEGNCQSVLTKRDSLGGLIWRKVWPGLFREAKEIAAGSFLMTGYNGFPPQVYVVKFDTTFGDTTRPVISSVTSVNRSLVKLFPNPANDLLNIDYKHYGKNVTVNIYSADGKRLFTAQLKGNSQIDVSNWDNGVYWIELGDREHKQTEKLVILR